METISYLVWHLFLPLGFRLSYHITLPLYVVSIDCGLKSSDRIREDSKVHVSKQRHGEAGREGKYGSQIVLLHPAIVLAQHQQPEDQLVISSGSLSVRNLARSNSSFLPFPLLSFSPDILPRPFSQQPPTP